MSFFYRKYVLLLFVAACVLACLPLSAQASSSSSVLDDLIQNMKGNRFVKHDKKGTDSIALMIGSFQYYFLVSSKGGKNVGCIIEKIWKNEGKAVAYEDMDCDGQPETKNEKSHALTKNELKEYSGLVREYGLFVEAMRKFKSYKPESSLKIFEAASVTSENRTRLIHVLRLFETTSAMKDEPDKHLSFIVFVSSNVQFGLMTEYTNDGKSYTKCIIDDYDKGDKRVFVDVGCSGTLDSWWHNDHPAILDPIPNAFVYKSLLLDLERFLEVTAKVYPRQ